MSEKLLLAHITEDRLWEEGDNLPKREGTRFFSDEIEDQQQSRFDLFELNELAAMKWTAFKAYDDDGIYYYGGWLKNDDECIVQQFLLRWMEHDAGVTTIKVRTQQGWIQEIS